MDRRKELEHQAKLSGGKVDHWKSLHAAVHDRVEELAKKVNIGNLVIGISAAVGCVVAGVDSILSSILEQTAYSESFISTLGVPLVAITTLAVVAGAHHYSSGKTKDLAAEEGKLEGIETSLMAAKEEHKIDVARVEKDKLFEAISKQIERPFEPVGEPLEGDPQAAMLAVNEELRKLAEEEQSAQSGNDAPQEPTPEA